jgi:hypothetical protein
MRFTHNQAIISSPSTITFRVLHRCKHDEHNPLKGGLKSLVVMCDIISELRVDSWLAYTDDE